MTFEICVTPAGRLVLSEPTLGLATSSEPGLRTVAQAFSPDYAAGLFALASVKADVPIGPSISYWRDFSRRYLSELCRTPEFVTRSGATVPLEPPDAQQLNAMISCVPPMRGAEYLTAELLQNIWRDLDTWVNEQVSENKYDLSGWLKRHAPMWHQVGRVCFHLAENKRDEEYPFAFLATYAPQLSSAGRVQYQPLNQALKEHADERNKKALLNLLLPVHLASEKSELVRELVETNDVFHALKWTPADAYRFLKEVPVLEESGLLVRMPDWWRKRQRPRVSVTIGSNKQKHLGSDALLDFKMEVAIGDLKVSPDELKQLMNADDGLVYLKGEWIEVDRERLSQALEHWKHVESEAASGGISFVEGMRLLAGATAPSVEDASLDDDEKQWSFVNAGSWLAETLAALKDPTRLGDSRKLSDKLHGNLRPYQQVGHDWLRFVSSLGLGACLADDMGLGKTVQVISLLLSIKDDAKLSAKPSLLVLPASLLSNWKAELQRFAPTLSACFIHPSETPLTELSTIATAPETALADYDVVATTYGMLLRQKWLLEMNWRLIVLDEAQAIKNPSSQQTRAVKKLKGESRLALTGTPVENRLSDLWSLFDFLSPGLLGSSEKFKRFVAQLNSRENQSYAPLRNLVTPYILRRLKTDKSIISDLPDKTETKVSCGLAPEQAALYARSVEELSRLISEVDGIQRRGLVLSFLLKFKQICNHPSQLQGDGEYNPAKSGKFDRLRTICEEIASRQEKVIVFTQFREMTEPLASFLSEVFGQPGLVLHGGTPVGKRKSIVDQFQAADGPPFMVLSIKAGGTGLNLTAASHVVHFDRWWNPAVENQATDRAYRIGQHRNVLVHKFICRGTIEEKIDKLISEKVELADSILTGGAESILTEMSDKELLDLVSLDLDRVSLD